LYTAIYDAFRITGNEFTADSLMSNRGIFEQQVRERLEKSLGQEGFIVEEFTSSIEPPETLRKAIDAKNEAVQQALKAENEVKAAEARAKIATAKAQGFADSLMIAGKAEADYNKLISASLSDQVIRYYSIEK
jgi:regulator of protease activity HflC (stomatin/prohibitin superfamily)